MLVRPFSFYRLKIFGRNPIAAEAIVHRVPSLLARIWFILTAGDGIAPSEHLADQRDDFRPHVVGFLRLEPGDWLVPIWFIDVVHPHLPPASIAEGRQLPAERLFASQAGCIPIFGYPDLSVETNTGCAIVNPNFSVD